MCWLELFLASAISCFILFSYFRNFRHSYFIISGLFIFVHFRIIPSYFRFVSQSIIAGYSSLPETYPKVSIFWYSIISGNLCHSYFINSGLLCISQKFVLHPIRVPIHHFYMVSGFYISSFSKLPSFIYSFPNYIVVLPSWSFGDNLIQAYFL